MAENKIVETAATTQQGEKQAEQVFAGAIGTQQQEQLPALYFVKKHAVKPFSQIAG